MQKVNTNKLYRYLSLMIAVLITTLPSCNEFDDEIPTINGFTDVQPMTGIVLWEDYYWEDDGGRAIADVISLEYSYMAYSDVLATEGSYNWSAVEAKLNSIASRKHQAILRFYYVYPGFETTVPQYIKDLPNYDETEAKVEGKATWFCDWSNDELKDFTLEFYTKFAQQYDDDPRLAFLQVGFGLWAEYHIYDGPFILGQTFPSKAFQEEFFNHMDNAFLTTQWSISIDAAGSDNGPFHDVPNLLNLNFGVFDDSFMCKPHASENEPNWNFFNRSRYQNAPAGGEFSYYSSHDQKNVLAPSGAHGESYESFAERFHITYMIGGDQPSYHAVERIKAASLSSGYKFEVLSVTTNGGQTIIKAKNIGVAPIYYDAFFSLNNVRSIESLKTLMPGQERVFTINYVGDETLRIDCDRLVEGQIIQFITY